MRTEQEIRRKYELALQGVLAERHAEYTLPIGRNCKNSRIVKVGTSNTMTCLLQENKKCPLSRSSNAQINCRDFECKHTIESVETDMVEIIQNPSRCGQLYPKLAVLIWALSSDAEPEPKEDGELLQSMPEVPTVDEFLATMEPADYWDEEVGQVDPKDIKHYDKHGDCVHEGDKGWCRDCIGLYCTGNPVQHMTKRSHWIVCAIRKVWRVMFGGSKNA